MTIGPVTTISGVSDAAAVSRVDPFVRGSVRTELPPRLVVRPVSAAEPTGGPDREDAQPARFTPVDRTLTIDAETRQLVSQVFDQRTGELLSQVPDQALLRLKAYAREALAVIEARRQRGSLDRIA